jgi:hypothetical protein
MSSPVSRRPGVEPDVGGHLPCREAVGAGDEADGNSPALELTDGLSGAGLGWVVEREQASQGHIRLIRFTGDVGLC